jgi:hypothetical protein
MSQSKSQNFWNIPFQPVCIPDDHFSLKPEPNFVVGKIFYKNVRVQIKINPTDARAYRVIVVLDSDNLKSTLSRPWTIDEMDAVSHASNLMCLYMASIGCMPQKYFAGNNAMEETDKGYIVGGENKEPLMLHDHVAARGKNDIEYILGHPMINPKIGEELNLKGEGIKDAEGNIKVGTLKVKWDLKNNSQGFQNFKKSIRDFMITNFSEEFDF